MKAIYYSQILDLTHSIDPNIPIWPGDPPVEFETVAQIDRDDYYLRRFSIGEHSGTHLNSPNSFFADRLSIDNYSPQSLVVPAVVIDICHLTKDNFDYALTVDDILQWEKKYNCIPDRSLVLLYTGWQNKWGDAIAYFNLDERQIMHFPGFSGEATQFLISQRAIAGVGIDTHGVDPGCDRLFTTNKLVLQQSGLVLENLNHLDRLPPVGTTLVIGILRLKQGSGSPVSVLAFVP